MATADLPTSPALSAYSASSYDMISSHPRPTIISSSLTADDSDDDEIVYNVSEPENSFSDDDFVVLNRPLQAHTNLNDDEAQTPMRSTLQLADRLGNMEISPKASDNPEKLQPAKPTTAQKVNSDGGEGLKQKRRKKKNTTPAESYPSPEPSPVRASSQAVATSQPEVQKKGSVKPKSKKKKKQQRNAASPTSAGLGSRPIVDDISERLSVNGDGEIPPSIYKEAAVYISSYLSNPEAQNDKICRLTLLQSLIIELGLANTTLPSSLNSAKTFLKAHAFLNVREYLAVRGQGPEAVQKVLHPSRSALIKDIRKKNNRASLKWVKQHGLQVLLVSCFH